jgi:hypothetical protein
MTKKPKDEPTQETPQGAEIPIPTRKDVFGDLAKVARPRKPPDDQDDSGPSGPEK